MTCKIVYNNQSAEQVRALKVIKETKNFLFMESGNFKIKVSKKTKRVWRELNGYKFEGSKANTIIIC